MNRRELIKRIGVLGLTGAGALTARPAGLTGTAKKKVLRFAHLTDVHVEPELRAAEGLAACLHAIVDLYDDGSFDNEYFTYGWNG